MLLTFDEAIEVIQSAIKPHNETEIVPLSSCLRRALARDVVADRPLPPFNRATMDGFAVVASDISQGVTLPIIGTVSAGEASGVSGREGSCVSIATGAPVPDGYDAVVKHESTRFTESEVEFLVNDIDVGTSIHSQGADAQEGDVLIEANTELQPHHIGIAAAVGVTGVCVKKNTRLCLISSGDELVDVSESPMNHQIRNSNGPMLQSFFESHDCQVTTQTVRDDALHTKEVLEQACATHDVVVTIGGISAGKKDFIIPALDSLSATHIVQGVAIQPGKPLYVGHCNDTIVLGLPGNPVSALVCATLFGKAILRLRNGQSALPRFEEAELLHDVTPNPNREQFRPCCRKRRGITIPAWQGSGDLIHTSTTTGLVRIPKQEELIAGSTVLYLPWS